MRPEWEGISILHKDPTEGGRARILSLHSIIQDAMDSGSVPKKFTFLEVGVFQGDVAEHLLASFPGMVYTGIDCWKAQDGEVYEDTANNQDVLDEARRITMGRTYKYGNRCMFVEALSPGVIRELPDWHYNVVYIDANHSTDAVKSDIFAAMPKLADNGIMCGHDYCDGWETVKDGVNMAAADLGRIVVSCWPDSSVWYFK